MRALHVLSYHLSIMTKTYIYLCYVPELEDPWLALCHVLRVEGLASHFAALRVHAETHVNLLLICNNSRVVLLLFTI